ncbi:MAG: hypothetical protein KGL39_39755 [Patescibacteria group bacterium]|nr:hypothetical protein [Patescibacteria group bacterium]
MNTAPPIVADGVTDDTVALQTALTAMATGPRNFKLPVGKTVAISRPLVIPNACSIEGDPWCGESAPCASIIPLPGFRNTNPAISGLTALAPCGLLQTQSYLTGEYCHNAVFRNVRFANPNRVQGIFAGLMAHNPGELFIVERCAGNALGFCITGNCATLTMRDNLVGGSLNSGVHFYRNPLFPQHGNQGKACIENLSGDGNAPSMICEGGAHNMEVSGIKYEKAIGPACTVLTFGSDPAFAGVALDVGYRPILTASGWNVDPGVMDYAIVIQRGIYPQIQWTGGRCMSAKWLLDQNDGTQIAFGDKNIPKRFYALSREAMWYSGDGTLNQ